MLIKFPSPYGVSFILIYGNIRYINDDNALSFRLLTEYHSFLLKGFIFSMNDLDMEFPSPYGVSFILM